ncbi:hypothetical protein ACFRCW_42965 [Streptomyces sp. NPDC056653]|uniref:hypothetical protein n=1 Tax=Streptomyces sp. NPDC056653 TaxID=3345894 RepID=UPI0036A7079E
MLETYLSWYREGRMDESEFRSVTDLLAESGLTVEPPTLGCGMLLDLVAEQVKLPPERILELVGLLVGPLCSSGCRLTRTWCAMSGTWRRTPRSSPSY